MNVGLAADLDYQLGGQCADERVTTKVEAVGEEVGNGVGEILAPIQPTSRHWGSVIMSAMNLRSISSSPRLATSVENAFTKVSTVSLERGAFCRTSTLRPPNQRNSGPFCVWTYTRGAENHAAAAAAPDPRESAMKKIPIMPVSSGAAQSACH